MYTIVFVSGDVLCLLVQAAGGGIAASASKAKTQEMGANIMVCGIVLQLLVMVLFSLLFADFVIRYTKGRPVRNKHEGFKQIAGQAHALLPPAEVRKARLLLIALVISTILIFIRSICKCVSCSVDMRYLLNNCFLSLSSASLRCSRSHCKSHCSDEAVQSNSSTDSCHLVCFAHADRTPRRLEWTNNHQ